MAKVPQVKNRAAAAIQITAEQLLRIANDRGIERVEKVPTQFITDKEELLQYQHTKRKDFEDQIRRNKQHIGICCRYALWEASQKEYERSRSVFERALDVDYRNQTIWLKYADMEMKSKFINHARNVWDRAVVLHPRVDSFWYKYSYMEEMVGAVDNARQVFERWMDWEPDDMAWAAFIKFEMRQGEIERARAVYERYVAVHPTCRAYLKYARWEEKGYQKALARNVYERALSELHPAERTENLLVSFARFEERCKEVERARVIYQYALSQLGAGGESADDTEVSELKKEFIAFEKRHGSKSNIEGAIVAQRREHYTALITTDQYNYDAWFDFIRLEESELTATSAAAAGDGDQVNNDETAAERVRSVYKRAVACVPPVRTEKRYWRRYIYLWINYAIFEELTMRNVDNARAVYKECLQVVPHKNFTFGKVWLLAAQLEVRQKDLAAARKILGHGIGMCGKENIFKGYIELELQLGEIDRCRSIYAKYLETMPHNCSAWKAFAALETSVGETQRARAIYDLAVSQWDLDMPELMWKAYIDFETAEGELDNARALYERLIEKSNHVKVWISFAQFEAAAGAVIATATTAAIDPATDTDEAAAYAGDEQSVLSLRDLTNARAVFNRGYDVLKSEGLKEERLVLLEAWRDIESAAIDAATNILSHLTDSPATTTAVADSSNTVTEEVETVLAANKQELENLEARFPRKLKMHKPILAADGVTEIGAEEYYDYAFPDDEKKIVGMKLLEKAMAWKMAAAATAAKSQQQQSNSNSDNDNDASDEDGGADGDDGENSRAEENATGAVAVTLLGKRKTDSEEVDIEDM